MNPYQRLLGSGPTGVLGSVALLGLAAWAERSFPSGALGIPAAWRQGVLGTGMLLAAAGATWAFRSLPPAQRGRSLCVRGAFRWVRHPLYASLLVLFAPALALYLDHWLYLLWALLLHPYWHAVIRWEERPMQARFGEEYVAYAGRTGRFFPRFGHRPQ